MGPQSNHKKILIVSDVWSRDEESQRQSFVGAYGKLLQNMLEAAKIPWTECTFDTMIQAAPAMGSATIDNFLVTKKELPPGETLPAVKRGKYLPPKFNSHVLSFLSRVHEAKPNIIIALGAGCTWALLESDKFVSARGIVTLTEREKIKIIPTYSLAELFADWSLRPIFIADLMKAYKERNSDKLVRSERQIWIEPSINHIQLFYETYVKRAPYLAFDIETMNFSPGVGQITCISFAPTPQLAIVIPILSWSAKDYSYWPTLEEELLAWKWIKIYLHSDAIKVTQNGTYDVNFLWAVYGIYPKNWDEDTLLLHHAIMPEMKKSLGFMATLHTDAGAWKGMRTKTFKKDN